MRERIEIGLTAIEQAEGVRIVYAVESGSRAWGFPSQDSDYDIRFLYVRPVDAYLSVMPVRDVVEYPISDALDLNGWDVQKALGLFRKSNPTILEWLHSSIVYRDRFDVARRLRDLEPVYFTVRSSLYHYLSLAKGQWQRYLQGEQVAAKKYFYVLRPVLACGWLLAHGTFPPRDSGSGDDRPSACRTVRAECRAERLSQRLQAAAPQYAGRHAHPASAPAHHVV